jgi:hypothetical protein
MLKERFWLYGVKVQVKKNLEWKSTRFNDEQQSCFTNDGESTLLSMGL